MHFFFQDIWNIKKLVIFKFLFKKNIRNKNLKIKKIILILSN